MHPCPGRSPLTRFLLTLLVGAAASRSATGDPLFEPVNLSDPEGDGYGPGTYVFPAVEGFERKAFDLLSVRIARSNDGFDVEARFAAPPKIVTIRPRQDSPGIPAFLPVVDIYLTQGLPDAGHRELLPGRRVAVEPGLGWDRAIVLSALPEPLETHYRRAAPALAHDVCFARGAQIVGSRIRAHVPQRCLPLQPRGYLVVVTALGPGAGFAGYVDRLEQGASPEREDPYVRSITPGVGLCNVWEDGFGKSPCSIGGCSPCGWHPSVLDAILPEGASQVALLRDYDAKAKRLAALPFWFAPGARPAIAPTIAPPVPRHAVHMSRGREVTLRLPLSGLPTPPIAGTLAALVCPGDQPGGTLVVKGEGGGFLVLERITQDPPLCEGAWVVF